MTPRRNNSPSDRDPAKGDRPTTTEPAHHTASQGQERGDYSWQPLDQTPLADYVRASLREKGLVDYYRSHTAATVDERYRNLDSVLQAALSALGSHDAAVKPGYRSYHGTQWRPEASTDFTQGSCALRSRVGEGGQLDVDFTVTLYNADEYAVAAVQRLLSTDLQALVGIARQENATERLVQLLRALAPDDPLAAIQLNVAATTLSVRQEFLQHVPVLTSAEVHHRAGFPGGNPSQTVLRWRKPGKIFAIAHGGRELYPAFQFDAEGRPLPIVAELLAILRQGVERSDWDHALWFTGESGWLDGKTPLECLQTDPEAVKRAAQQEVLPA